jgi:hypothetical protein
MDQPPQVVHLFNRRLHGQRRLADQQHETVEEQARSHE